MDKALDKFVALVVIAVTCFTSWPIHGCACVWVCVSEGAKWRQAAVPHNNSAHTYTEAGGYALAKVLRNAAKVAVAAFDYKTHNNSNNKKKKTNKKWKCYWIKCETMRLYGTFFVLHLCLHVLLAVCMCARVCVLSHASLLHAAKGLACYSLAK